MKYYFTIVLAVLFLVVTGCKQSGKEDPMSEVAQEQSDEKNLSAACKKDVEKLGKYLDDAKVYLEKKSKGENLSEAEEKHWEQQSEAIGREFQTSATAYTDPDCARAIMALQTEFTQVMMKMAQQQMQDKMGN